MNLYTQNDIIKNYKLFEELYILRIELYTLFSLNNYINKLNTLFLLNINKEIDIIELGLKQFKYKILIDKKLEYKLKYKELKNKLELKLENNILKNILQNQPKYKLEFKELNEEYNNL